MHENIIHDKIAFGVSQGREVNREMAARCDICGKGTMFGHNVSHSNRRTKRVFKANLRKVRIIESGKKKTIKVCMKCYKRLLKEGKVVFA